MLKKLEELQDALAKGDAKPAGDRLRDLQKRLQDGVRKQTVDPTVAPNDRGVQGAVCRTSRDRGHALTRHSGIRVTAFALHRLGQNPSTECPDGDGHEFRSGRPVAQ